MLDFSTAASNLREGCPLPQVVSEMDDLEASSKPVLEVASWLNWWVVADCDLTNSTKPNSVARVRCLFIIGDSQWNS